MCGFCYFGFIGDGYLGCNFGDLCINGLYICYENV